MRQLINNYNVLLLFEINVQINYIQVTFAAFFAVAFAAPQHQQAEKYPAGVDPAKVIKILQFNMHFGDENKLNSVEISDSEPKCLQILQKIRKNNNFKF